MERAVSSCSDVVSYTPHWLKMFLGPTSLHRHTCVVLLDLTFLPIYFDLTFTVFLHSSVLMHPEHYTDLDNLDTVENNLRHSAKGSNDAYDVPISLTLTPQERLSTTRLIIDCGCHGRVSGRNDCFLMGVETKASWLHVQKVAAHKKRAPSANSFSGNFRYT